MGSGRRWWSASLVVAWRGAASVGGHRQLLPAWIAASARALSYNGGRQGERGKATGAATGNASSRQPRENPWNAEIEFNMMFLSPAGGVAQARAANFAKRLAQVHIAMRSATDPTKIYGEREAQFYAWQHVCRMIAKDGDPKENNLLEEEQLDAAFDEINTHIGALERQSDAAGLKSDKAAHGPDDSASIVLQDMARQGAAETLQRAGRGPQTGAKKLKMTKSLRLGRDRNLCEGAAHERGREGDSAVHAGPLGIGGKHEKGPGVRKLPAHMTKLREWARERARVNSNVCVEWLGKGERKKAGFTCEVPAETESFRGEVDAFAQARPAASAGAAQPVHGAGCGVLQPALHQYGMADVHAGINGQIRHGFDHRLKLDREFWDTLLQQRDPTKGLREVALRSLLYESSADADEKDRPIDPTLWWMESLVRIKWGGGGYLPPNLRRGQESQPVKGEKVLINHVIQVVAQAPCRLRVRWAALLHDIGKPSTAEMQGGRLTFTSHERVGAAMVDKILSAYGYDEKFRKEVATLVLRSGRIRMVDRFNDQGARRLMAVMGPLFDDLLDLYAADCTSGKAHRQAEHQARADLLTQHVQAVLDRDRLTSLRSPLNGHDIMRITGLKPGMHLGRLVNALREDYLRRGPYSSSEANEVVARVHAQLKSGEGNPDLKYNYCRYKQGRVKRSDMVGSPEAMGWLTDGFPLLKPLQFDAVVNSEPEEREEVHVLRLRLDNERSRVAQGLGEAFCATSAEGGDVFRDVAVRRDTSLYTLAKVVTHAFDFDFDDDFAFYRRRRGLECPGAEAAYSGIPTALRRGDPSERVCVSPPVLSQESIQGQEHEAIQYTGEIRYFDAQLPKLGAVHEELLLEQDFELLARACGSSLRSDNHRGGVGFRYDALDELPGHLRPDVEWKPDNEHEDTVHDSNDETLDSDGDGDQSSWDGPESHMSAGAESLSYPLRLPQLGPASLIHTLVGNLFDRSRRSLVFALYNGGPWYIRIDFVEARERKHYELSLPCVTARLGHAPRLQSLKHKQRRDAMNSQGSSGQL